MAVASPGFVKVRLQFHTNEATTETALLMARLNVRGPYLEEIWVLMPKAKVLSILNAYRTSFAHLLEIRVVPSGARLFAYKVEAEPTPNILAYVIED